MPQDEYTTQPPLGDPRKNNWTEWVGIPKYLLKCPISLLCPGAKTVYMALVERMGTFHSCTCRIGVIADLAGMGYEQAKKHLNTLAVVGLIHKRWAYKEISTYTLCLSPILQGKYDPWPNVEQKRGRNQRGIQVPTSQVLLGGTQVPFQVVEFKRRGSGSLYNGSIRLDFDIPLEMGTGHIQRVRGLYMQLANNLKRLQQEAIKNLNRMS